ncbi:MAG: glycosyltransferase family 39 protein [Bryobacteraceae bacterium]|jgi:hypothetical protein
MLAALAALFGAAFTVSACYAMGALLLALVRVSLKPERLKPAERLPLTFLLGAACLHLAVFLVLMFQIAYKPVMFALLAGVITAAVWRNMSQTHRTRFATGYWFGVPWTARILFGLIFAAFTVVCFVNAWAPEASPDGSGYHLGVVSRYVRSHGMVRITTSMYASLSEGVEMIFVPAFAFGRHSAAALVHFSFSVALALAVFAYGRRVSNAWVGGAAALLTYLSPVVMKDGSSAYIDVATAAVAFAVFYWLEIWDASRDPLLLIPVGLLAGYTYAAKYTAAVMLLYALGFVAWRARKIRPLLVVGTCAALMIAPWIVKDWIFVQNPVAPFASDIFRNPYVHVLTVQGWTEYLRSYGLTNKWTLPMQVTLDGGITQGIIGPAFLAAPLALLALRFPAGRRLLVPGFLLLATYFGNVGTRFLIPCLPFFSLAMALALQNVPILLVLLVAFHAVTSWPWVVPLYANRYVWRIEHLPYDAALRKIPEDQFLRQRLDTYGQARAVEDNVPRGQAVLNLSSVADAYTSREILMNYAAAFNELLSDFLNVARIEQYQPTRMLVFRFPDRGVRRIRLLETAKAGGGKQWSVHELRFLRHDSEIARRPEWRLRAFPNPWDVQLAFDNSDVTRWRSWETAFPGMYIDVDFGRMQPVDEVRMETSRDDTWPIHLQVEMMDERGRWVKLTDTFEEREMRAQGSLRRAATYELHQRGIDYLIVADSDIGADDYRDDPEAWRLQVVAKVDGATLYKVVP